MLTIRFEVFKDIDDKNSVYYTRKKNQRNKFSISNDLYDIVMEFKELKISQYIKKRYL